MTEEFTENFAEDVLSRRKLIKEIAYSVKRLKEHPTFEDETPKGRDEGEIMANIMLAYRHLEDASMRLGKVLQANDGGVSVYDKESTVGVDN